MQPSKAKVLKETFSGSSEISYFANYGELWMTPVTYSYYLELWKTDVFIISDI